MQGLVSSGLHCTKNYMALSQRGYKKREGCGLAGEALIPSGAVAVRVPLSDDKLPNHSPSIPELTLTDACPSNTLALRLCFSLHVFLCGKS